MSNQKFKQIYSNTYDKTGTSIKCGYNIDTNHIGIYTRFFKVLHIKQPLNKECSTYLGIQVAERVLTKIFTNIQIMPVNNKGYDIICGKGYLIDIKSSVIHKNGSWAFPIRKNTIADYFLCLAFNNRNDLNPLHLWLIPGKDINHLTGVGISPNTLNRWSQYELIEKTKDVISCCNTLKE